MVEGREGRKSHRSGEMEEWKRIRMGTEEEERARRSSDAGAISYISQ